MPHCDGRVETCQPPFPSHWTDEVETLPVEPRVYLRAKRGVLQTHCYLLFYEEAEDWNTDAEHGRPLNRRRSSGLPSEALSGSRPHDTACPKVRYVWATVLHPFPPVWYILPSLDLISVASKRKKWF